ncbi:MAG TPA: OsmC family protein [Micromonosporaceae bacterium]|nr:OsmC family protein [Micromonosporaceae bacterium]
MTRAQPAPAAAMPAPDESMEVRFRSGESYEVKVRGHGFAVDQPADAGGEDGAPTPTELFVASLATCVAFYAGRYLTRHGHSRDGLGVSVAYRMASDRPARVSDIVLTVRVPEGLPEARWPALQAVATHCTVHNSIVMPPAVRIELAGRVPGVV